MSNKSAQNGAPVVAEKPKPASVATRVEQLEAEVALLKRTLEHASRLLAGMLENQAVQVSMPQIEQQIRGQFQQKFAEGGLGALMPTQLQEAPPQPAPQVLEGTPAP